MQKTILITGSTDGIGLETARMLVARGHHVLLHGRNAKKLKSVETSLSGLAEGVHVESYLADLARMSDVEVLAKAVAERHTRLDVVINNAGILRTPDPVTPDGLDVRFAVKYPRALSVDTTAFTADWVERAGDQPVLSGSVSGRSSGTDWTCQAIR